MRWNLLLVLLLPLTVTAEDWPQWLGPKRDGSSTAKIAPWKKDPAVLWELPVSEGHSSPVIADGLVFLHVAGKDLEEERTIAVELKSGKIKWNETSPKAKFTTPFGNGPRATPIVTDGKLITFGITGLLVCREAATGKELWSVDTLKTLNSKNLFFGISSSPMVVGKNVLVMVGGKESSILAYDLATGKPSWNSSNNDSASYAAPMLWKGKKSEQAVFLTGSNLLGVDPVGGKVVWEQPFRDRINESSTTPVRVGDIIIAGSVTVGSIGLKLTEDDNGGITTKELWRNKELTLYFSTPIAVDDKHIYLIRGQASFPNASADLLCVEAETGKVVWKKEKVGKYHASLTKLGDGKLLMLDDFGNLSLLEPNVTKYTELARSEVTKGKGDLWASPALSDGKIVLRDAKRLFCLEIAKE